MAISNFTAHIDPQAFGPRGLAHLRAVGSGDARTGAAALDVLGTHDEYVTSHALSLAAANDQAPETNPWAPPSRRDLQTLFSR